MTITQTCDVFMIFQEGCEKDKVMAERQKYIDDGYIVISELLNPPKDEQGYVNLRREKFRLKY